MFKQFKVKSLTKILIFLITPATSFAAGYQMRYQSAETMGTAFASDMTGAKTASGFFNNPAMIAFMEEGKYFSAEFTSLFPSGDFSGQSAYPANTGDPNTDGFGKVSIMPSLYYGQKISDKLFITATLTVPWATSSDYDKNWVGKYHATKTFLATYNLTPSVTYAVNDKLAVSGGIQVQYATGELGSMVDLGAIAGGTPGQDDGEFTFNGNNIGFGAAFSAMFKPTEALRLGLQYRSQIKHNLSGTQDAEGQSPYAQGVIASPGGAALGVADGQDVETDVTIPSSLTLGASYLLNESLDLHGSLSWTGWSSFDKLTVKNTSSGTSSTTQLDWSDTFFVAAGADYFMNENLTLRGGLSYETGAPPDNKRTPRGVDEDRLGIALGASYKLTEIFTLHGAFTQLVFLNKPTIDLVDPPQGFSPTQLTGEYTNSATLIRLAVSGKF